jgi:hypothetical protein
LCDGSRLIDPDSEVDHASFTKWFDLHDNKGEKAGQINLGFSFPKTAWSQPHYPSYGDHIRQRYIEGYGAALRNQRTDEQWRGGRIEPKSVQRGEADRLRCKLISDDTDDPSFGASSSGKRRENSVWPAHWFGGSTVPKASEVDRDRDLSMENIIKLDAYFKALNAKAEESARNEVNGLSNNQSFR